MNNVPDDSPAHAVSLAIAFAVGLFLWSITGALSKGTPFGNPDSRDATIFYAPILGTAVPLALRAVIRGSHAGGTWVMALAPVLGLLNYLLVIMVSTVIEGPRPTLPPGTQRVIIAGSAEALRRAEAFASAVQYTTVFWFVPAGVIALVAVYRAIAGASNR